MTRAEKREKNRRWYAANREKAIAAVKAWERRHPERVREYARTAYRRQKARILQRRGVQKLATTIGQLDRVRCVA